MDTLHSHIKCATNPEITVSPSMSEGKDGFSILWSHKDKLDDFSNIGGESDTAV